jgi:hypothetical protein
VHELANKQLVEQVPVIFGCPPAVSTVERIVLGPTECGEEQEPSSFWLQRVLSLISQVENQHTVVTKSGLESV